MRVDSIGRPVRGAMKERLRQFARERGRKHTLFCWGSGGHGECGDGSVSAVRCHTQQGHHHHV